MIYYNLGQNVEASSTCIGEESGIDVITPEYQAHSTLVRTIPNEIDSTYGADALITDRYGICIGVRTADCVPVLLYDAQYHAIAAIHSGWKGTAENIIACTVAKMQEKFACNPCDMKAIIAPCIHVEAFEVGDEVYEAFCRKGYEDLAIRMNNPYVVGSDEKWHIDLPAICLRQLSQLNITDVYTSQYCTYKHHDMLYSYRYSKSTDPSHRIITSIKLISQQTKLITE